MGVVAIGVIALAIYLGVSGRSLFERKITHREIDAHSIAIKEVDLKSIPAIQGSDIHGSAWRILGVEYGYLFFNLDEEKFPLLIQSISQLLGRPSGKSEGDKEYIECRWSALYGKFAKGPLPFVVKEDDEIKDNEWIGEEYSFQVCRIKNAKRPVLVYITWTEGKESSEKEGRSSN